MKPHATLWERFEGWYWKPIQKLKELPEGDGAFLAMSAGLALCERYYRTVTNTHEGQRDDLSFRLAAAKDLVVEDWKFEIGLASIKWTPIQAALMSFSCCCCS